MMFFISTRARGFSKCSLHICARGAPNTVTSRRVSSAGRGQVESYTRQPPGDSSRMSRA